MFDFYKTMKILVYIIYIRDVNVFSFVDADFFSALIADADVNFFNNNDADVPS